MRVGGNVVTAILRVISATIFGAGLV
jgi:hypothetical protein